jgi:MscS family membrane protein
MEHRARGLVHRRRAAAIAITVIVVALVALTPGARAESEAPTPRAAVAGYLEAARAGDWEAAAAFLDLRRIPAARRPVRGPALARDLKTVLDQTLALSPDLVTEDADGVRDDGLAPELERLGTVQTPRGPVDLLLRRVMDEAGQPTWKFAAATLTQVPALAKELGPGALAEWLPAPLFDIRLFDLALWQWIGLLLVVVLAYGVSWVGALLVMRVVRPMVQRSRTTFDERLLHAVVGPVRLGLAVLVFAAGILLLALPVGVRTVFVGLEKAVAIGVVAWVLIRMVDVLSDRTMAGLVERGRTSALGLVPAGRKAAKAVVLGLAVIAVLQNLGVNITGILAGLGIGGLAVALAAQKTVENLFGGVTLLLDQPVRVGDFCRFGDKIGTVEEIGLRSTRVRTLERTVVSIPNAEFASIQLENFARRDRIWLKPVIGLRYETTPDQLRYVLVEIRKMLYAHPRVERDPARIRFVGFGAYSLDLEIFAYVNTTDFGEFLAIREDIQLRIMDIVAASGTGFAFPSSTTYFARDGGLDRARAEEAEARVRAWRAEGAMWLPEFPPDAIAALDGTLDYPPAGAAVNGPARAT